MSSLAENKKSQPGLTLILLFSVCFMPVAGAWLVYHFTDFWKTAPESDQRYLLDPPVQVANVRLTGPGTVDQGSRLHGKWNLLYLPAEDCRRACEQKLDTLQQIRRATGKEAFRVRLVLAAQAPYTGRLLQERLREPGGSLFLLTEDQDTEAVFKLLRSLNTNGQAFYLIDPLGNLIVRYPVTADPAAITRDLKRLLRYSRVG